MTLAVREPITKINQSKCSIAGPISSKSWTGHCLEWSRTCVFAVFAFFSRVITLINQACSGPYWENICPWSLLSRLQADILPVLPSRLVNKIYGKQVLHKNKQQFKCSNCLSVLNPLKSPWESREMVWVSIECNRNRNRMGNIQMSPAIRVEQ